MSPKVKFELAKINNDAHNLSSFCLPLKTGWDWSHYIYRVHPVLKEKLGKAKSRKKKLEIVKTYTKKIWKEEYEQLKTQKILFQTEWDKINDRYMNSLSKVLETDWPKERRIIYAMISINPICPRFLKNWTFSIFYLKRLTFMKETVAHEVLHFLYFKKWKEVFPDSKEKTFDAPHLEWHLSEILAPVILSDKRIQTIIKSGAGGYAEYNKTRIGKRNLIQHFENLYKNSRKRKEPFAQFLQTAYKEAKKHKDKILNA